MKITSIKTAICVIYFSSTVISALAQADKNDVRILTSPSVHAILQRNGTWEMQQDVRILIRPGVEAVHHRGGKWNIQRKEALSSHETLDFTVELRNLTKVRRESNYSYYEPAQKAKVTIPIKSSIVTATVFVKLHQKAIQGIKLPISYGLKFVGEDGVKFNDGYTPDYTAGKIERSQDLPGNIQNVKVILTATYLHTNPLRVIEVDLGTHDILDLDVEFDKLAEPDDATNPLPALH